MTILLARKYESSSSPSYYKTRHPHTYRVQSLCYHLSGAVRRLRLVLIYYNHALTLIGVGVSTCYQSDFVTTLVLLDNCLYLEDLKTTYLYILSQLGNALIN